MIELSWYGDREVGVPLGGSFHSDRLTIRASQVGTIAPARRATRGHADRLGLALDLLRDPVFDGLLTAPAPFDQLPDVLSGLADGARPALCQLITYDRRSLRPGNV